MTIAFNGPEALEELDDSPRLSFSRSASTAVREFLINWDSWPAFVAELMPTASSGIGGFAAIDGFPFIRCERVEVVPYDDPTRNNIGDAPQYVKAKVTAHYTSKIDGDGAAGPGEGAGQNPGDRTGPGGESGSTGGENVEWVEHQGSIGAEFLTLPDYGVQWAEADQDGSFNAKGTSAGMMIPLIEHQITLKHVRRPPWGAIRGSAGKVNENGFAGAAQKRVLFVGCNWEYGRDQNGNPDWTLEYRFSEKTRPWDHFYRPSTRRFELLVPQNGLTIYDGANFASLFQNLYGS